MRSFLLLFCVCFCTMLSAQDSMRIVQVIDRQLTIPASMQHVRTDTTWCKSGYITDGTDTLYYNRCRAIMPMRLEMMYMICDSYDSADCAEANAEARRYNDSLRAEDPRIGMYTNKSIRGDHCWYNVYYPNAGHDGYLALEITSSVPRHQSFLISTTVIDADKQGKWKRILESISY